MFRQFKNRHLATDDKIKEYAVNLLITNDTMKAQPTSLRGGISDVAISALNEIAALRSQ